MPYQLTNSCVLPHLICLAVKVRGLPELKDGDAALLQMSVPIRRATSKNIPEDSNILLQSTIDYSKPESWNSVLCVCKLKNIPFWTNIRLVYCILIFKLFLSFIFIPRLFLEEKNPNQLCQSMINSTWSWPWITKAWVWFNCGHLHDRLLWHSL